MSGSAVVEAARFAAEAGANVVRSWNQVGAAFEALSALRAEDVEIATAPKTLVWRQDKVSLYRFEPTAARTVRTPILLCYGLIGRWSMMDLQPDRSLVRNLLAQGLDVWLLDWGSPTRADRFLGIDDYVAGYLADAVREVSIRSGVSKINLFGVCEGGTFAAAHAALEPDTIASLVLAITPIDFHAGQTDETDRCGLLNLWMRSLPAADVERLLQAHGTLSGAFVGGLFNQMAPVRNALKYGLDLAPIAADPDRLMNWLRMESWIADRPNHPGEAARQWICELYQENRLARGVWELDGRAVELRRIAMPVLNVYADSDHIVPPPTSRALAGLVGSADYAELRLPGGHVGIFVGGRAQALFAPAVADFLRNSEARR